MDPNNQQPAADAGAQQPTQTQEQIDDWGGAEADFLADKGIDPAKFLKKEEPADEQKPAEGDPNKPADPADNPDAAKGGEADPNKKPDPNAENADPNDDPNLEQQPDEGTPHSQHRAIQREIEQDRVEVRTDVKKELYPDWSDDILDDQGKAMKTPRDVMNHINPNTGKRFTEEEATAWLFAAQKHKDKERAEMTERVEHIADVMITQRDEADYIKGKYGKLLAQLPNLRKEIWADYRATLVVDKESGLIVDAPVSLKRFFERALKPYADYAAELQAKNTATQPTTEQKPTQTDAQRKQTQQDREEITSAGGGSVEDPEEKAWADAARKHYEGK